MRNFLRTWPAWALALVLAGACAPPASTPTLPSPELISAVSPGRPNGSPPVSPGAPSPTRAAAVATPGWVAARVEQPVEIEGQPTDAPVFCSPCHPILGTYIDALAVAGGRYVALGFEQPPLRAAAWVSADAASWRRVADLPAPDASSISAVVATPVGGLIAVGGSGGAAAVWSSADGAAWQMTSLAAPAVGETEQLTAIARVPGGGYVAGGYVSRAAQKTATFWRSADGVEWSRVAAPALAGPSEVTGIAAAQAGGLVVAVGISGDERRGDSAVWRSADGGATWRAASGASLAGDSLAGGRMLAVAAGPGGFTAVGENTDQTAAMAWTSADGASWRTASGPALVNYGLEMVMTAVAWDGAEFVADGWRADAGNGSAVVWTSPDGVDWTHLPQDATFSGAGMAAILGSPRLVAAGTMGWPDTHAAQVWLPVSSR
jgi:hypothetical protein